jgi:hypothetical protein
MSNLLTNPVVITAPMSESYQNSLPAINQAPYVRIQKIQWVGQTSGNFVIEDGNGNVVAEGAYVSADQQYDFEEPRTVADFQVTTLGSGTLLIHLR